MIFLIECVIACALFTVALEIMCAKKKRNFYKRLSAGSNGETSRNERRFGKTADEKERRIP